MNVDGLGDISKKLFKKKYFFQSDLIKQPFQWKVDGFEDGLKKIVSM